MVSTSFNVEATNHDKHTFSSQIKTGDIYYWDITFTYNGAPVTPSSHPGYVYHDKDVLKMKVTTDPTEYEYPFGSLSSYFEFSINNNVMDPNAISSFYEIFIIPTNYYGQNYFSLYQPPYYAGYHQVIEDGIVEEIFANKDLYLSSKYDFESGILLVLRNLDIVVDSEQIFALREQTEENDGGFFSNLPVTFTPVLVSLSVIVIFVKEFKRRKS